MVVNELKRTRRIRLTTCLWITAVANLLVCPPSVLGQTEQRPPIESIGRSPTVIERIDGGFAKAVSGIEYILFTRLFSTERQYIQFDHVEDYIRERGGKGNFERYQPEGSYSADQLTEPQVDGLEARGELLTGPSKNVIRQGTAGDREVEYVSIVIDNTSRYVLVKDDEHPEGRFHKVLPKRDLISDDQLKTWDEVRTLARLGRLQLSDEPADPKEPYLQTESAGGAPIVVLWLATGSIIFTFYMGWFNIWGFRHAIEIVRGRYDNPNEPGEVTHFQALASALSATVGLGNIAGVTIAMTIGGPGAFFWMVACGVFGMTSKFVECTLGQKYRHVKEDGTVLGGPMQYLHEGLKELGLGPLGLVLSIVFSVMCIMASFGGGNMFQANQSGSTMVTVLQRTNLQQLEEINREIRESPSEERLEELASMRQTLTEEIDGFRTIASVIFGILLAIAVGFVIIGGIQRIGAAAEKVVPTMCLIYVAACLFIIVSNIADVPALMGSIFTEAFTGEAFGGGLLGVLVVGVQRAAFSNEAGVGSAAIAHSAAKTEEPVREGAVALLGPFIDTIVVCSMTALVILITGAWDYDPWIVDQNLEGAALAMRAFEQQISWFPFVLAVAVVLFAFSTIISWSYYGERCWERLFGPRSTIIYRVIYVTCVFVGAIVNLGSVLDFSDMMILSMAFPNVLGVLLLSPKVKRDLADYWRRYKAGEFKTYN